MAIVEVELERIRFAGFIENLITSAPIPFPTLSAIGSDRLISRLEWGTVVPETTLPGFNTPAGAALVQVPLAVSHVSIAELRANAAAPGLVTQTTAWLLVRARPADMIVDLVAVQKQGDQAPQLTALPLRIQTQTLALPITGGQGNPFVVAGIVGGGLTWTIRFGTSVHDAVTLLLPPANRRESEGGDWLLHASPDFLVEMVVGLLSENLDPPPDGAVIEEPPSGSWAFIEDTDQWGVRAKVGLLKRDACPQIILDDVDVSVDINVRASFNPGVDNANPPNRVLNIWLHISSDASDWDSFRCWLGSAGLVGLVLGGIPGAAVSLVYNVGTLIAVGEIIRGTTGEGLANTTVDPMVRVAADEGWATYNGSIRLPRVNDNVRTAQVTEDGLTVTGDLLTAKAVHTAIFAPNAGAVAAIWYGRYSCSQQQWLQELLVEPLRVRDSISLVLGGGARDIPVHLFHTTRVEPASLWRLASTTTPALEQLVPFDILAAQPGTLGMAFIHTSAGIRRYDLPVPQRLPEPDGRTLAFMRINCRRWQEVIDARSELFWLPDPVPFRPEIPPLRQWLLTFERVPAGARFAIRRDRNGMPAGPDIELGTDLEGSAALEFLTDEFARVSLAHNLPELPSGVRISQRWLIPVQTFEIGERVVRVAARAGGVAAFTADRVVLIDLSTRSMQSFSAQSSQFARYALKLRPHRDQTVATAKAHAGCGCAHEDRRRGSEVVGGSPFSATLSRDLVAAVIGERVIVARPQGAVARTRIT